MKKLNQNSKEAGVNAQKYKHKHHEIIVRSLMWCDELRPKNKRTKKCYTPDHISRVTGHLSDYTIKLSYHQVYRRLKEMIKADLIEISANLGISPSGKPCSCYRLKSKKK